MAELKQFKLPDVGEGLTEADILRWEVKVGDTVVVNQVLVEVETAKAAVELPSPYAGVVHEIHFDEGVTVDVGQPIVTLRVGDGELAGSRRPMVWSAVAARIWCPARPPMVACAVRAPRPPRSRSGRPSWSATACQASGPVGASGCSLPTRVPAPSANPAFEVTPATAAATAAVDRSVLAKPPVRKLAKSLGVDLADHGDRTERHDLARRRAAGGVSSGWPRRHAVPARGAETRIPIKGVRKHTAAAMVASAFTAPHVTEFITVDVTEMMELRKRVGARPEFEGVKVSPLLFVARAVLWASKRTPIINSTWDEAAGEIVDQALREPRDRGGHRARPDRAEHQGCRASCRCWSWPTR